MSRKNYTEREKTELLTIVKKYKTIIENKCTNAVTVEKKNEVWEKIAQQYNSSAENPRTAKQLNTAYQNLKRLTRQKAADDNKQNYMEKARQSELKKFRKDQAEDKKAVMATGGGSFTPQLSEVGAQMLALMGEQIKPLPNSCDSATNYFEGQENIEENNNEQVVQEFDNDETEVSREPPVEDRVPRVPKKINKNICLKQKNKFENTNMIKRKFYQKKLECALLEKKTNWVNYQIALKKQKLIDMEIKIKELELSSKQNNAM